MPECTVDNICNDSVNSAFSSWEADPDSEKTLNNWQQKLDLTCTSDFLVGMIGASLFFGWCVTLLWLPNMADRYGRKNIFWAGMVIDFFLYIGLLVTSNLYVMITMWFSFGMMSAVRINVGYVYHMELLPKKW